MERHPVDDERSGEDRYLCPESQRLADAYIELARAGVEPDVEEFLARYPGLARELRPVVSGAALLAAEVRRFRAEHPDVRMTDILGVCPARDE